MKLDQVNHIPQRDGYGQGLLDLCAAREDVVVLDADVSASTRTNWVHDRYPDHFYNVGISEQDLVGTAAGLALGGQVPFVSTYGVFLSGRAFDQIRQTIAIGKLNVKICGSSSGLSDFGDGATHQCVEDMAIFRAVPNMTVICPADANETVAATKAIAEYVGPCYMRLNRNDYPNVTPEDRPFTIGMPYVLRDGTDIALFACGVMVGMALEAAEALADRISVKVINVPTIKPLNRDAIIELAASCKAVVTAEEHNIQGGLGSAIAEALSRQPKPMAFVGIEDHFGCSAHNYPELLAYMGLTKEHIMQAVEGLYQEV